MMSTVHSFDAWQVVPACPGTFASAWDFAFAIDRIAAALP
jgi:hypothetical protein